MRRGGKKRRRPRERGDVEGKETKIMRLRLSFDKAKKEKKKKKGKKKKAKEKGGKRGARGTWWWTPLKGTTRVFTRRSASRPST